MKTTAGGSRRAAHYASSRKEKEGPAAKQREDEGLGTAWAYPLAFPRL